MPPAAIGLDFGGTKTLFVLFDASFRPLETIKTRTRPHRDQDALDAEVSRCVGRLVRSARERGLTLRAVGAGCAGLVDEKRGIWRFSPNLPHLKNYRLGERLARLTGCSPVIGNDLHLGLYGEHRLGAARGARDVIGVFFGTGVGGALMIDGKIHRGASGAAGEIGHHLISSIGALAGSPRQGVLDDLASRSAIAGAAAVAAAKDWAPRLFDLAGTDVRRISGQTLADAIRGGDAAIDELVRSRARTAGIAISNLVDFISPELVVLGGGLVQAMPGLFVSEVRQGILRHVMPWVRKSVRVREAELGDLSVAAGAALSAWDRTESTARGRPSPSAARSRPAGSARARRPSPRTRSARPSRVPRRVSAPRRRLAPSGSAPRTARA